MFTPARRRTARYCSAACRSTAYRSATELPPVEVSPRAAVTVDRLAVRRQPGRRRRRQYLEVGDTVKVRVRGRVVKGELAE
jgi:hypothetical protein